MSETFHCPVHGIELQLEDGGKFSTECQGCPTCLDELRNGRSVDEMTAEERVEEFKRWAEQPVSVRFDNLHARFEQLVRRPVLTHELAKPEYLYHEILTGDTPSFDGILAKLPADKPVVAVNPRTGESKRVQ